jgi:hypothetical protein
MHSRSLFEELTLVVKVTLNSSPALTEPLGPLKPVIVAVAWLARAKADRVRVQREKCIVRRRRWADVD